MSRLRVMRVLIYEGDEKFIESCIGSQRFVQGKKDLGRGNTITEGFLSGDVGNISFVKEEDHGSPIEPVSRLFPGQKTHTRCYFCVVCNKDVPEEELFRHESHTDAEWRRSLHGT